MMLVERYVVTSPETGHSIYQSIHPDRLRVSRDGVVLLDVSMSGDSPFRPFLSAEKRRPWFYTGSPYGKEIIDFAIECGLIPPPPQEND